MSLLTTVTVDTAPYSRPLDLEATNDGGFVVAWVPVTGDMTGPVAIRRYDRSGVALTAVAACVPGRRTDTPYLLRRGEDVLAGCRVIDEVWPFSVLQRLDTQLQPIGQPTEFRDALSTDISGLTRIDDETFLTTLTLCESDWCGVSHRIGALTDPQAERAAYPRYARSHLLSMTDSRLLLIGIGSSREYYDQSIYVQRLDQAGRKLGERVRVEHAGRGVQAPGGDIVFTFGRTEDEGDAERFYTSTISPDENQGPQTTLLRSTARFEVADALVMPLKPVGVVLWNERRNLPDGSEGRSAVLQTMTADGHPTGPATTIYRKRSEIGRPVLAVNGLSYLVPIVRHSGEFSMLQVWRATAESSCGDVDADGAVTLADAQQVLAAASGRSSCPVCDCDLDSSGSVEIADAAEIVAAVLGPARVLRCGSCR